jgi:hypothetical protein
MPDSVCEGLSSFDTGKLLRQSVGSRRIIGSLAVWVQGG